MKSWGGPLLGVLQVHSVCIYNGHERKGWKVALSPCGNEQLVPKKKKENTKINYNAPITFAPIMPLAPGRWVFWQESAGRWGHRQGSSKAPSWVLLTRNSSGTFTTELEFCRHWPMKIFSHARDRQASTGHCLMPCRCPVDDRPIFTWKTLKISWRSICRPSPDAVQMIAWCPSGKNHPQGICRVSTGHLECIWWWPAGAW